MNDRIKHKAGDDCEREECDGHLVVYATKIRCERRVRYLHCKMCEHRPVDNKWIVPLEFAPRRVA